MTKKQAWYVTLWIEQQCDENMTLDEMRQWVKDHFINCDYGNVKILAIAPDSQPPIKR